MRSDVAIALVVAIFIAAGIYEVAMWRECLSDHSWLFCLRVLG